MMKKTLGRTELVDLLKDHFKGEEFAINVTMADETGTRTFAFDDDSELEVVFGTSAEMKLDQVRTFAVEELAKIEADDRTRYGAAKQEAHAKWTEIRKLAEGPTTVELFGTPEEALDILREQGRCIKCMKPLEHCECEVIDE